MLQHLSIRNIVLIASCDIPFEEGLCVLTGETGAGKSILLDALGLALGGRGDASLIRAGEKQASVTAEFSIHESPDTLDVMQELGLDADDVLVIRRVLSSDGKNRCFVNDQPVSVTGLKRIGETLLEVHGQHDQRGLLDMHTHLDILDAYGRLAKQREQVVYDYGVWKALDKEVQAVKARIAETQKEQDYLEHVRGELRDLNPQIGEEDELSESRQVMMQSEKMAETISAVLQALQGDGAATDALASAHRTLTRAPAMAAKKFEDIIDTIDRTHEELAQVVDQLESILQESEYDEVKLDSIEERLFALKAAGRKFKLRVDELPNFLKEIEDKLLLIDNQQEQIGQLESQAEEARQSYLASSQILSDARAHAAQRLQKALMKELNPLKMSKCRFRVVQEELEQEHWSARGTDAVRFEAATNTGQHYAPLHKIASGGELSRFMLALKVVLSSLKAASTLVFDEIDTGTGGAVADAIGARLALLSDNTQVLVVTHLPQVAARGNHHLFIEKKDNKHGTKTSVRALNVVERKEELARMLAGEEVTEEARGAARKLMEAAG